LVLDLDASYMRSYSPNVYPNPTDLLGFNRMATQIQSCTVARDPSQTRQYGSIPMKMAVTGNDPYAGAYGSLSDNLASALSGQTWTISVWAKASVATTGELFIFGADTNGAIFTTPDYSAGTISITNSWQRFSFSYTFTNASTRYIQFRLDGTITGGSGITIWWDGLQVERASAATNFNPYYFGNTSWRDVSGNNNNNGTLNGPTFYYSNKGSILFNGSSDYVSITNNSTLRPTSELTIEYVIQGAIPSGWCPIIGYGNGDYTNGNYLCWVETGGALNSLCRINNSGTVTEYRQYSGIGISSTALKCMSFTMRIGDSIRSYYNGVDTNTPTVLPSGGSFYYGGTTSAYQISGAGGAWLNGNIYYMRLYNRALTATEVMQNYEATKTRFGL
jgi:hypothetical protein